MDEPRFGRLWRRRAFGLGRGTFRRSDRRGEPPRLEFEPLVKALRGLADRFRLKFGRRARIRLVRPEQPFRPTLVDPLVIRPPRMDARALQTLLEAEIWRGSPAHLEPEPSPEPEPVRRSG